ncbi:MAG: hypothetical protein JNN30_00335 [Rhodanobacteraceae bacterium]|nr:hypothetical protein [Rhodanobacteraceae bacterium]
MPARLLRLGAWLLTLIAVAAALQYLAYRQLRGELVREALAVLSPLARGDTPYRWALYDPAALVGQGVFGECDFAFDTDLLVLRHGSRRCELGLMLRAPLDLRYFDTLSITSSSEVPDFVLQVREQLSSPQHLAAVAGSLAPQQHRLGALDWSLDIGKSSDAPQRAAMLRLRFTDLRADLLLHEIRLLPKTPVAGLIHNGEVLWHPLSTAAVPGGEHLPLFSVEGLQRPEALLRARDLLREQEPAALLVYRADTAQVAKALATPLSPAAHPPGALDLSLLIGLVVVVLAASLLCRHSLSPALHALLALTIPLWLVVGLQIGDDLDAATLVLIAIATLYAVTLARCDGVPPWRWFGSAHAWLYALAAPLIATLSVAWLGHINIAAFPLDAVPSYLLWACAQQYLICVVVTDRLHASGLPERWTVLAAAAAFSLLHAPNAALMFATLLGGLIWSALWLRERSLLAQALSHTLAALALSSGLPPHWLRSAEVSMRYFQ